MALAALARRIFGSPSDRHVKRFQGKVAAINALEPELEKLSDEALRARTVEFKAQLANGTKLDDLIVPAFATVREASKRVLGMRHFDVQLVGGMVLNERAIAEMRTGEGKTLVATLAVYLNALTGDGVHVVTVNDYLAKRDAAWMGQIYNFLGLSYGIIVHGLTDNERKTAYGADITYGTNNEFGFDYLRDNMTMDPRLQVQRGHNYAIVDEVDSILVDEARTPLIISGRVGETAKWYRDFSRIAERLFPDVHYEVDEAKRQVITTEGGVTQVEKFLNIENMYDHTNVDLIHHLDVALKAKTLYHRDVDYVVANGEIKIVDEFTGRILEGRRYSEGLHQAIEAKEGVRIKEENQTLATITLQNYFRLYEKLAGMTGTAMTEAGEFNEIYKLGVVEIPTNVQVARLDQPDLVYMTEDAKFNALIDDLVERHAKGQPVLVGTISIEKSERLSAALRKRGIPHEVLNAKQHEREATIIAQAGRIGAVTVATNMAGRGVDIRLGGNPEELAKLELRRQGLTPGAPEYAAAYVETHALIKAETSAEQSKVIELGGLYVLATERHEARRIDNQLRGRSGRQGDPGESRFYLSLEDDLMRRFATDRVQSIMRRLRIPEDVPIEHGMVTKAIERAQRQVESQNFEIRKNVLKYDEVMNRQRSVIYEWRNQVLTGESTEELVRDWIDDVVGTAVAEVVTPEVSPSQWDLAELERRLVLLYPPTVAVSALTAGAGDAAEVAERVVADAQEAYTRRGEQFGPELLRRLERTVVLSIVDGKWREHLADMDYLRSGVGLRAMGQRDPLTEYQREAYDLFSDMVDTVKTDSVRYLFHAQMVEQKKSPDPVVRLQGTGGAALKRQAKADGKVGRNELCPCGSGKKYKKCHGAAAPAAES